MTNRRMQRLVRVLDEDRYPVADGDEQDGGKSGKRLPDERKDEHRGDDAERDEQMTVYDAVEYSMGDWRRGRTSIYTPPNMNLKCCSTRPCDRDASMVPER